MASVPDLVPLRTTGEPSRHATIDAPLAGEENHLALIFP